MWREAVVEQFELLSWNMPGETKKNHEYLIADAHYPNYKAEMLCTKRNSLRGLSP
jgi:hypothetical protein